MRTLTAAIAGIALGLSATAGLAADITGAGASFPNPVYSKWAQEFHAATGNMVNYQSIGSSGGVKQITERTVTFGASDAPLKGEQLQQAGLTQWPQIIGGAVPAINLPGVNPGDLILNGDLLAQIYLGNITEWNDEQIQALNSGVELPATAIAPVYRADGSGTTFLFTNYLSKVSADFKGEIGNATTVQWPVGIGAKGNEGVANQVSQTEGAIGYVEYAYVKQNKMNYARMVNAAGKVVAPDSAAFAAAAASADWSSEPGYGVILTEQPGDASWPITGASFILMPKEPKDPAAAKVALEFFRWALEKGGAAAEQLDYVPMPTSVVGEIEKTWQQDIKQN